MGKRVSCAAAAALASVTSLLAGGPAWSNGFIFIDPAFHPAPVIPVTPVTPVTPLTPVNPADPGRPGTPSPRRPLLRGTVSTGLLLDRQAITVDIKDQVARTYIKQTFKNDTDRDLAGTYLFPLPQDATFSSFTLHIDGKPVEGQIMAAAEATAQYEQIVRSLVDPGLLEYLNYRTVRARIFPIPARGEKTVELEYTQILPAETGDASKANTMCKYRFPLKSAGSDAVSETKIDFKLKGSRDLRTIWSPSHEIKIERDAGSSNQARISFLSKGDAQEKDFLLYYTLSDKEMAANLITHKLDGEKGFFMLTLSPPVNGQKVMAKDVVLVADTSGSMRGEKMEQARAALEYVIKALNPEDRFSLVQFNTDAEAFAGSLLSADAVNKEKAISYIQEMESRGGTNIGDALATAVSILDDAKAGSRPAFLILMTDGEPTVGKTAVQELLKSVSIKRDLRLFDFGIGYDVNTRLLNKLAEEHHGTSQYLEPDENLETALSSFYAKIRNPVLSDVMITYEGIDVKDIYPRAVKDIFAGSQLLLLGRYKEGGKATIKLTGKVDGVEKSFSFPVDFAPRSADNSYLPRIWAMRRIGHLTEVAQENDNNKEIVDEIVELSKRYGIISAYTSFLSKDPNERRGVPVPLPMPVAGALRRPGDTNFFQAAPRSEEASKSLGARFAFMPNQRFRAIAAGSPVPGARDGADPMDAEADDEKESFGRALSKAKSSGQAAVALQRALSDLRSNMDGRAAADSSQVKVIGEKTFYLVDGYWVDSSFEKIEKAELKEIEFGSKDYFELARNGLASYLGAGPRMILVYEGRCYRISKS